MPAACSKPARAAAAAAACRCRRAVVAQRALRPASASASASSSDGDADAVAFLLARFRPWVLEEDGARRCLAYVREKEGRAFCVEKARVVRSLSRRPELCVRLTSFQVLDSLETDFLARAPEGAVFELPKTWPGMRLVLQRCSVPLDGV